VTPRRVVVAPDKFKGSLTAVEVAGAVAGGIRSRLPGADVIELPVADGGEGTVAVALAAGFTAVRCPTTGPLGDEVEATYARSGDTAVVEMSAAAGLALVPAPDDDTAVRATTYGVGVLLAHAVAHGARRVVLGLGGSATTDGGAGMVAALRERTDLTGVDLVLACDVDNPLTGPHGAAPVYGPQKGAGPEAVDRLDARLTRWADEVAQATGADLRDVPGAGAAGGTAFAGLALLGGRLAPGAHVVAELAGLPAALEGADLLVVGEGSLDEQSLRGKGPVGVAASARATVRGIVAVAGRNELSPEQAARAGIDAVYALTDIEPRLEVCLADAAMLLDEVAARIVRDWLSGSPSGPR
jgi:glycerate kinase